MPAPCRSCWPRRGPLRVAAALQALASLLTVVPFVGMAMLVGVPLMGRPGTDGPSGTGATGGAGAATIDPTTVLLALALVAGGLLLRFLAGGMALSISHRPDLLVQRSLRLRISEHLGRVRLGWFSQRSTGVVRKALQDDVAAIHYLVAHGALDTIAAVVTPLTGIAFLLAVDWRLALIGVATIPLYMVLTAVMMRDSARSGEEMNSGLEAVSRTIVEFVRGIAVVKTFGRAGVAHAAYRQATHAFARSYDGLVRPMLRADALASIPTSGPVVLLVSVGAGLWFQQRGWVDHAQVLLAAAVATTLPGAIIKTGFAMEARQSAVGAAGRLTRLLATPTLPVPDAQDEQTPRSAEVELEAVTFGYDPEHPVVHEVSLRLPAGSVTALVGPSGAGKSTLAGLVARLEDPDEGRVLIGGTDVREMTAPTLYRHVGFVLQDVQLVGDTIRENIRLARPEASEEQVRAAAVMPAHLLTPVIVGISAPATIAVTMVLLDWGIGVPLLVAVPLVLLLARVLSRLAARTEAERHRAVVAVDDRVLEFARAQAALRAAGRAQDPGGYAPLRRALEEQDAAQRLSLRRSGLASGLNGIVVQTVLTALVVLVSLLVLGGSVTGLEALALLVVASRFTAPLTDVADFGGELRNAQGELERIRRVLAVEPLPEPSGADGTDAADSSAPQRASTADETEAGPAAAGDGADRIRAAIAQPLEDEPLAWFRRKLEVVLAGIGARLVRGSGEAP